jgi:hypothetical protein
MNAKKPVRCQARVVKIKRELLALGPLRPGSLSQQWNVCGKTDCRCKDPKRPRKHGPYCQLSYTWRGKSQTVFVSQDQVPEVEEQIANYRRFRTLCQKWVDAALEMVGSKSRKTNRGRRRTAKH